MARALLVSGLAGGLLAASALSAAAEDARPAAAGCSGFLCKVFGSRLDDRPAPVAPPTPTSTDAQAAAAIPDPADPADGAGAPRRVAAKHVVKPKPAVTIAAGGAEAARVKALVAALPGSRARVVRPEAGRTADFAVVATADGAASGEKARLFTEQLHVVAGADIKTLADLGNKVVSFGPDGGPAQAVARKAFGALGIGVTETPLDINNALDGVATGDVAAVVVLAPQPDPQLAHLKGASALHLVPWPAATPIPDGLVAASIPGTAYPGLAGSGATVPAVGVAAALDASGAASPAAKAFLASLARHATALSRHGFDLVAADLAARAGARVASAERR